MGFLNTILDIFFPTDCIACGKKGTELCISCISSFPNAEHESEKWIYSLFDYRHPTVKKSIQLLKYKGRRNFANIFAKSMYPIILEELADLYQLENFREPILIPIPLAKKRKMKRGFNQSLLICKKLIKLDKNKNFILKTNILIKPKDKIH